MAKSYTADDIESILEGRLLQYMKDPEEAMNQMLTEFRLSHGRLPEQLTRREIPEVRPGLLQDISKDLSEKLELICGRRLNNRK